MAELSAAEVEPTVEKADEKCAEEQEKNGGYEDVQHVKDLPITIYIASVTLDSEMKIKQRRMMDALNSKKVPFNCIDIANDQMARRRMRHMCEDPTALPPRIFKGSQYLGNYLDFQQALDDGLLNSFLHII